MKRFLKICLILAAVFAVLGIGFLTGGIVTGATPAGFYRTVSSGSGALGGVMDRLERLADNLDHHLDDEEEEFENVVDDWEEDVNDWAEDFSDDVDGWVNGLSSSGSGGSMSDTLTYDAEEIRELKVDLKYGNISILPTDENVIRVEGENTGDYLICRQNGNTLKVEGTSRQLKNADIWILVPVENSLREADIELDAAALTMEDFQADKLDVSVGAGQFHTDGIITADEIKVEVGTGEMRVGDLVSDKIDLECGLGSMDIRISGSQADYSYEVSCGMGEIRIGEDTYSSLADEKKVQNSGSRGNLDVSCGMGAVTVEFTEM